MKILRSGAFLALVSALASCAGQRREVASTHAEPAYLKVSFAEGARFHGVDERGRPCTLEVVDIRNQGLESKVQVKISFAKKAKFELSHPTTGSILGEPTPDDGVLRGFPGQRGARGELRVYLDRRQRPSFLTYYSSTALRNPANSAKRFCEDLVESR
jgi:hypothetical protein